MYVCIRSALTRELATVIREVLVNCQIIRLELEVIVGYRSGRTDQVLSVVQGVATRLGETTHS